MYQLVNSPLTGNLECIRKTDGSRSQLIPFAEDNRDYQEYLAWLAEGNEPLPADPVE